MSSKAPCAPSNITFSPARIASFSRTAVSVTKGATCSAARAYSSYIVLGSSRWVRVPSAGGRSVLLVAEGVLHIASVGAASSAGRRRAARCGASCPRKPARCLGWWCQFWSGRERSPQQARSCGGRAESPARDWTRRAGHRFSGRRQAGFFTSLRRPSGRARRRCR